MAGDSSTKVECLHFLDLSNEILCLIMCTEWSKCATNYRLLSPQASFTDRLPCTEEFWLPVYQILTFSVFCGANKPKVKGLSFHKYFLGCLTVLNLTGTAICDEDVTFLWTQSALVGCLWELQVVDCTNLTNQIAKQVRCQYQGLEILQLLHYLAPSTVLYEPTLSPRLKNS